MTTRALLLAGLLALGACASTPKIDYDADPTANFAAYHSYSWTYSAAPQGMNPLIYQRVRGSIDATLSGKGYSAGDPGDFAVGFTLGRRDRVEVTDFGSYGPYYRGWGGWGHDVDVRNITDGTLTIDIYDSRTKQPVWHGIATQEVSGSKVDQAAIDTAVRGVLANFPPPATR